ncbi:MAG TPA: endo-1,4-beta-xylanase [Polyangiales bacterium]|nr:endo-1,4-beta-xylanase [Polyangiales bacterium]
MRSITVLPTQAYGLFFVGLLACSQTAPDAESEMPSAGAAATGTTTAANSGEAGKAANPSTNAGRASGAGGKPAAATGGGGGATVSTAQAGHGGSPSTPIAGNAAGSAGTATSAAAGMSGQPAAGSGEQSAGASGETGAQPPKKFVGNITTSGQVRDDFDKYWDQITPENEGKWGSVEGTRNQMNWAGLDRVHDYAKSHNIVFKQHTLVWGSQQPGWLGGLSKDEQKAEVEEWIRLFCERYPDVALIDVVNEPPPHTMPVYMDALGGAGTSGYDWIVQAFKWARMYCPNAILILNDYNNIEYGGDNSHFLDIVDRIRKAGAPIDALGAQAHDAHKLSASVVKGFIDKLSATGLPVYITEYDIDVADDAQQSKVMMEQFPMFWSDDHIAGVTLWGYVVGATWRPNTGLMTSAGVERPALKWLRDFIKR